MSKNDKSVIGLLSIIVGIFLFIFFVGKFAIELIAAVVSIALINFGLDRLGLPSLQHIIFQIINSLIQKFRK